MVSAKDMIEFKELEGKRLRNYVSCKELLPGLEFKLNLFKNLLNA